MPITYYSKDDIRGVLLTIRKDCTVVQTPLTQSEMQDIVIGEIADMLGVILDEERPEDEVEQLKQRIEKLERDRLYVPVPYYPINPSILPCPYPYQPAINDTIKIVCTNGTGEK